MQSRPSRRRRAHGLRACGRTFPVVGHIPRFVRHEGYARGFGIEWTHHARSQFDSHTGTSISAQRFFSTTRWPSDMTGKTILEVGSGSGRFTEQAVGTGAMVVSMDMSRSVDANLALNGNRENLLIIQADLYRMPVRPTAFDGVFCFGVLQHTPDVERAFFTLPRLLRSGGELVVDVYRKKSGLARWLSTKNWIRPITSRIPPERLYPLCRRYVDLLWPLVEEIRRIPRIGKNLNWLLLVADYHGVYPLPRRVLKEWTVLDTFDMLMPVYDHPQSLDDVRRWFAQAGLVDVEVGRGFNGIEGRGRRAISPAATPPGTDSVDDGGAPERAALSLPLGARSTTQEKVGVQP